MLRVDVTPFFASVLLVQRMNGFAERYRAIDRRIETIGVGAAPGSQFDAAILLPAPPRAMVARPLIALRLVPACAPAWHDRHRSPSPARCSTRL